MKILIFGASGSTGHQLVKQAIGHGYSVTAFVRDPAKLKVRHRHLNLIKGNVINYQVVEAAVKDQDAVVSALGASSPFKFDQAIVDGMANIIKAMETNAIGRLVYMSFAGVKESRHQAGFLIRYIAPKILRTEIAGHEAREKMIKQSSLLWTIVRSPTLSNGQRKSVFRAGEDIQRSGFTVSISRADVANFMLWQLTDSTFLRKAPLIMY